MITLILFNSVSAHYGLKSILQCMDLKIEPRNTRTTRKQNGLAGKLNSPSGRTFVVTQLVYLSSRFNNSTIQ